MKQDNAPREQVDVDQAMRAAMEKVVPTYDSYMKKMTMGRERALRETTVRLAQVKPGDNVLEVGCGTGTLTLAAKRQAGPTGKVCGIDVIPGMIELSQRKAAEAHEDVDFRVGSIAAIPFPENTFDAVLCSFMIFHMSDETRQKGVAEIYRVLKPQGRLLVLDLALPPQRLARAIAQRVLGFALENDLHELLPLLEASGFTNTEVGYADFRLYGFSVIGFARGSARKG